LRKGTENKYEAPFSGPHNILKVNTNGTVRLCVGSVTDTVNIRHIEPYKEVSDSIHGGECNMQLSKKRRQAHELTPAETMFFEDTWMAVFNKIGVARGATGTGTSTGEKV
jgi:hypothetical protein